MAKRVNVGYMSGYHSKGSLQTRPLTESRMRERQRGIDDGVDVCLTCRRENCTGKCKKVKDKKVSE